MSNEVNTPETLTKENATDTAQTAGNDKAAEVATTSNSYFNVKNFAIAGAALGLGYTTYQYGGLALNTAAALAPQVLALLTSPVAIVAIASIATLAVAYVGYKHFGSHGSVEGVSEKTSQAETSTELRCEDEQEHSTDMNVAETSVELGSTNEQKDNTAYSSAVGQATSS